ncbi:unnamed protein product, partial [Candida parapsilosis]
MELWNKIKDSSTQVK